MRFSSLGRRALVAVVIAIAIGGLTFLGAASDWFGGFRLQLTDTLQPTGKADDRVAVIAVDSDALRDESGGRWPWPRTTHAEILNALRAKGAGAVLYDVAFTGASTAEADRALAQAVSKIPTVLSAPSQLGAEPGDDLFRAQALDFPIDVIANEAVALGHASVTPDPIDGVVRSVPLFIEIDGELVPSLAMAMFAELEGLQGPATIRPNGVSIGGRFIPTGPRTILDVAYAPELQIEAEDAPVYSAADVISGQIPDEAVRDKIILIGVTDASLGDDHQTPVAKDVQMPGVLIHANALNTMLTGSYIHPATDLRTALWSGALALAVAGVTLLAPVLLGPPAAIVALVGYLVWAFLRFEAGAVLDLLYPAMAVVVAFFAAVIFRYFTELRGRRQVSALFSQYVPKEVANELIASGRVDDAIRGERLHATVMFCDMRAFTAMSSKLKATELRDVLNVYYEEASLLLRQHGGTLLNYIGDEVFAVWGAPVPDEHGADRAVAWARAMQDANAAMNARLEAAGLPTVTYGIGLHTGEITAAHVGTEVHRQYTILGDTVNCASRLCTIAGRTEIVCSAETYAALTNPPPSEELPGIKLKGVGRDLFPHRLWPDELKDPTGEVRGKLEA